MASLGLDLIRPLQLLDGGKDPLPAQGRGWLPRIAARRKKALVFLDAREVWAFEADARLTFVHSASGKLDIDVSLAEIEASPLGRLFVRVHRSWLANLALVKALEHDPGVTQLFVGSAMGESTRIHVPVSRDRVRAVRDMLLATAVGVRRREAGDAEAPTGDEAPSSGDRATGRREDDEDTLVNGRLRVQVG